MALLLLGSAVAWSASYPSWLGWVVVLDGIGWVAVAVQVASRGFEVSVSWPAMVVSYVLALWIATVAVLLWRRAGRLAAGPTP